MQIQKIQWKAETVRTGKVGCTLVNIGVIATTLPILVLSTGISVAERITSDGVSQIP